MANTIKLIVEDTELTHFEGDVDRITSYNEMGRFDVYPMHANFISIISQQIDIYQNKQKVKEIKLEQAIMKVKKDVVHVFLGIEKLLVNEDLPPMSAQTKTQ
ncbi:MAG: hypothetical protein ACR2LN_02225 [Candidatus Levyibacteriota bacterium]